MVFMCWFKPLGLNQPTLHLSYEDHLIKLNLTTLERRRESGDIIQTYKIMHGLSDVNINELFTMVEDDSITRRHSKKGHKQYNRLDTYLYVTI